MDLEITARHCELSDRLKDYVDSEISKLVRYHNRIVNCRVTLESGREGEIAVITLHLSGKDLITSEVSNDIFKSIDLAIGKMKRKLKRFKGKRYSK